MKTRKDTFGEIDLHALQQDFEDNEKMALSYLDVKFGNEVVEEIKKRIQDSLSDNV